MSERPLMCCEDSIQAGEGLAGTAPRSDVWLLLEYAAPWGAKAFESSDLPEPVKERLSGWLKAIPNARLQLIRQEQAGEPRAFYVALSPQAALYRFDLSAYDSLLALDIPALAGGAADYERHRSQEKLFLVCTNARRDACCALHGPPLYRKIRAAAGDSAWQSNHIGGHRFAGTLVCLPHGVYYGRVADPTPIVESYRQGSFYTDGCRGRCTLPPAAQSAEIFLRQQLGLNGLDALRLLDVDQNHDRWTARFAVGDSIYAVEVRGEPVMVRESTGDPERRRLIQHVAADYELVT